MALEDNHECRQAKHTMLGWQTRGIDGEVAACCGEDGMGPAMIIEAIGSADSARTPILILAMSSEMGREDTQFFSHLVDQQALTTGIRTSWGPLAWARVGVHYSQGVDALQSFPERTGAPVVRA